MKKNNKTTALIGMTATAGLAMLISAICFLLVDKQSNVGQQSKTSSKVAIISTKYGNEKSFEYKLHLGRVPGKLNDWGSSEIPDPIYELENGEFIGFLLAKDGTAELFVWNEAKKNDCLVCGWTNPDKGRYEFEGQSLSVNLSLGDKYYFRNAREGIESIKERQASWLAEQRKKYGNEEVIINDYRITEGSMRLYEATSGGDVAGTVVNVSVNVTNNGDETRQLSNSVDYFLFGTNGKQYKKAAFGIAMSKIISEGLTDVFADVLGANVSRSDIYDGILPGKSRVQEVHVYDIDPDVEGYKLCFSHGWGEEWNGNPDKCLKLRRHF